MKVKSNEKLTNFLISWNIIVARPWQASQIVCSVGTLFEHSWTIQAKAPLVWTVWITSIIVGATGDGVATTVGDVCVLEGTIVVGVVSAEEGDTTLYVIPVA